MKKKRNVLKRGIVLAAALLMVLGSFGVREIPGGGFPVEVPAKASGGLKQKAAKAYRNFVKKSGYGWFCVRDVDRDGLKELVLTRNYPAVQTLPDTLAIYKYKNGAVRKIGEDFANFGYCYNKKTKRIHGLFHGTGSMEDWYLTITKSGQLKRVYLSLIEVGVKNGKPIHRASYAGRKISKKAYFKKKREWNRNYQPLKVYRVTGKNIKKYI